MRKIKKLLCISLMGCMISTAAIAAERSAVYNSKYPAKYTEEYVENLKPIYKKNTKEEVIFVALDMLKGTNGEFSRKAILGNNLSGQPVKIEFKDLSEIGKEYASFDALGWKKSNKLYIFINQKHKNAPPGLWRPYWLTRRYIRTNTTL